MLLYIVLSTFTRANVNLIKMQVQVQISLLSSLPARHSSAACLLLETNRR